MKRDISKTETFLARRLARRFSVLGGKHNFRVFIGEREVQPSDMGMLPLVQYLWTYSASDGAYQAAAINVDQVEARDPLTLKDIPLRGWLGTAFRSTQLRDEGSRVPGVSRPVRTASRSAFISPTRRPAAPAGSMCRSAPKVAQESVM